MSQIHAPTGTASSGTGGSKRVPSAATATGGLALQNVKGLDVAGNEVELEYEPSVVGKVGLDVPFVAGVRAGGEVRYVGSQMCENPEVGGLQPNDPPQAAADLLRFETHPVMAVSHLPLVERLVGRLLAGHAGAGRLVFRPGTAAALTGGGDDWTLDWLVHPDMV